MWKESSDRYPKGYHTLEYEFDFLNYAGIHRPVNLVAIPKDLHVNSVKTATAVAEDLKTAVVYFEVDYYQDKSLANSTTTTQVELLDMKGNMVIG